MNGWALIAARPPDGLDVSLDRRPERQEPHRRRNLTAAEPGYDADTQAGCDEGELGGVLGGFVGDVGFDPVTAQDTEEPVVAARSLRPADPTLVVEVGNGDGAPT